MRPLNEKYRLYRFVNCFLFQLMYFFYTSGEKKDEIYLNLVLEFIPETVYKVARQYSKSKQTIPVTFIKLYMYQLFRSLAYIHSQVKNEKHSLTCMGLSRLKLRKTLCDHAAPTNSGKDHKIIF